MSAAALGNGADDFSPGPDAMASESEIANSPAIISLGLQLDRIRLRSEPLGPMIRSHWMVENGLHWVLDMIFRDDECRVRTDNAPFNLAIVKHIALNVLRTGKGKDSLRMRRKVAAWHENAVAAYIAA
jgi:hypothetical protein